MKIVRLFKGLLSICEAQISQYCLLTLLGAGVASNQGDEELSDGLLVHRRNSLPCLALPYSDVEASTDVSITFMTTVAITTLQISF